MGKTKGTSLIRAVKTLRANKDEARKVLPERLHGYLEERILVSSWYPEEDAWELLRALAKIMPDTGMDNYEFMGRILAHDDLRGIYASLLREGDPAATLRRTAVTWGHYHDTGKETVLDLGDDHVVLEITGYDHPSRESCSTVKGWIHGLVTMAGGKDIRVVHDKCVLDGASACRFETTWTR
jgi:hypothetical protein